MQRAMSGDCVAWKPEIAPQAIVMKSVGTIGSLWASTWKLRSVAPVSSGICHDPKSSAPKRPRAIRMSATPKSG